jgi:PPOX class probable F420-dependent enzyme
VGFLPAEDEQALAGNDEDGDSHRATSLIATERRPMTILDDNARKFLEQPFVGTVTTLRQDGSPHSTIVWVDSNGDLSFNTAVGRAKERHLRQDPRVSLLVVDPENTYRWVAVSGTAELTTHGADDQIDRLAKKYLGQDEYPWRNPEEERITVRIRPEHVDATGLDG